MKEGRKETEFQGILEDSWMKKRLFCQTKRHQLNSASALTEVIPGRQVLVLAAGVSLLPIQQEVIDHLLLVLPADEDSETGKKRTFKSKKGSF